MEMEAVKKKASKKSIRAAQEREPDQEPAAGPSHQNVLPSTSQQAHPSTSQRTTRGLPRTYQPEPNELMQILASPKPSPARDPYRNLRSILDRQKGNFAGFKSAHDTAVRNAKTHFEALKSGKLTPEQAKKSLQAIEKNEELAAKFKNLMAASTLTHIIVGKTLGEIPKSEIETGPAATVVTKNEADAKTSTATTAVKHPALEPQEEILSEEQSKKVKDEESKQQLEAERREWVASEAARHVNEERERKYEIDEANRARKGEEEQQKYEERAARGAEYEDFRREQFARLEEERAEDTQRRDQKAAEHQAYLQSLKADTTEELREKAKRQLQQEGTEEPNSFLIDARVTQNRIERLKSDLKEVENDIASGMRHGIAKDLSAFRSNFVTARTELYLNILTQIDQMKELKEQLDSMAQTHDENTAEAATEESTPEQTEAEQAAPGAEEDFELIRELGSGQYGTVYYAKTRDGKELAIKVLKVQAGQPEALAAHAKEVAMMKRLNERLRKDLQYSPYVSKMTGHGITKNGEPYIAFEYIPGKALKEYMKENNPTFTERVGFMRDVLYAQRHFREADIARLDLHANNIMITPDGSGYRAVLIDYGLSQSVTTPPPGSSEPFEPFARSQKDTAEARAVINMLLHPEIAREFDYAVDTIFLNTYGDGTAIESAIENAAKEGIDDAEQVVASLVKSLRKDYPSRGDLKGYAKEKAFNFSTAFSDILEKVDSLRSTRPGPQTP